MVNLLNTIRKKSARPAQDASESYGTYQEIDTTVPPKARPCFNQISVNGVEIPEQLIMGEAQNHPANNPGEALLAAAKALVVRQLLLCRAKELGIKAEHRDEAEGRTETEEDATIRLLIETEVEVPQAGEDECLRYYSNNKGRFCSEPLWEARHILIGFEQSGSRQAALNTAQKLLAILKEEPAEFSKLASDFSVCPSASQGGNLGQLSRGSTVDEFEKALEVLQEGETSQEPVESRYGFHIIRLDHEIEGNQLPFNMVQDRIAGWLEASAWSKAISQYIALLTSDAEIKGISMAGAESSLVQ